MSGDFDRPQILFEVRLGLGLATEDVVAVVIDITLSEGATPCYTWCRHRSLVSEKYVFGICLGGVVVAVIYFSRSKTSLRGLHLVDGFQWY